MQHGAFSPLTSQPAWFGHLGQLTFVWKTKSKVDHFISFSHTTICTKKNLTSMSSRLYWPVCCARRQTGSDPVTRTCTFPPTECSSGHHNQRTWLDDNCYCTQLWQGIKSKFITKNFWNQWLHIHIYSNTIWNCFRSMQNVNVYILYTIKYNKYNVLFFTKGT